jgi:hypothetical protein
MQPSLILRIRRRPALDQNARRIQLQLGLRPLDVLKVLVGHFLGPVGHLPVGRLDRCHVRVEIPLAHPRNARVEDLFGLIDVSVEGVGDELSTKYRKHTLGIPVHLSQIPTAPDVNSPGSPSNRGLKASSPVPMAVFSRS